MHTETQELPSTIAKFGLDELEWANRYLAATELEKEVSAERAKSKAALLDALGELNVGLLPDGRTVRREIKPVAAELVPRKATFRTLLAID